MSQTPSTNLSMSLIPSFSPPSSNNDRERPFESESGPTSSPIQASYDLPSELWFRIFQFATTVSDVWSVDVGDPFDNSVSGQTPISDPTNEQRRIEGSISTKWHIILVSHKWHDLALPILYDCIYLRRFRDLFLVYHTLSKSQQHHNNNNSWSPSSTSMNSPTSIRSPSLTSASTTTPPLGWWTHRLDLCMPDVLPLSDSHSNSTELHPLPLLLNLLPHLKILTISASVSPPPHLLTFPSDDTPTSIPVQIHPQYSSYSSIRCPSLHIPTHTLVSLSKSLERLSWRADSEWVLQPDKETYWGILRYLANGKGKLRTFESGMGGWNLFVDFCLLCDFGAGKGMADGDEVEAGSASASELRHCAVLPVWHKCSPTTNVSSGIQSSPSSPSPSSSLHNPTHQLHHPYPNLTSISLRVLSAQIHLLPFLPHFLSIQGPLLQTVYLYVVDPPALAPTLELIGEYCPALTKVVLDVPERVWSMGDYGFLSEKLPVGVRYLGFRMEWSGPCEEEDGWDGEAEDMNESGRKRGERRSASVLDEERRKVVWESIFRVLSGRSAFQIHSSSVPRFLRSGTNAATPNGSTADGLNDGVGGGLTVVRILEKHWCAWLRGRKEMGLGSNYEGEGDGEWCRELGRRGVRVEDMWGVEYGA